MRFWYLLGCSVSKRPQPVAFVVPLRVEIGRDLCRGGGGGGGERRPGTEKRCSHNLQSNALGGGFTKGRENFPQ